MFALFERLLQPTATSQHPEPPPGLIAFYWHFARQAKGLFAGLFAAGFAVALLDSLIPVFIGRIVTLITSSRPETLFAAFWPILTGMGLVLLVLRPLALTAQNIMANQAIAANVTTLIRWQSHWHVVRQSWTFFQNDFAGRIANRVMQTGPAIRESLVALITGGDSGIGRAIAVLYAREGADVVIHYNRSQSDADDAVREIEKLGRKSIALRADLCNRMAT